MKAKMLLLCLTSTIFLLRSYSQPCTTSGDQTSYGTNNVWRGYVYDGTNFNTYRSYVTEGNAGSPAFDQSFGGDNVNYTTTGCFVNTETFSVRYKLTKTFANDDYEFTVGADDGYRLSLDGGATWAINQWNDQSYTTTSYSIHLNGSVNMVLEYYENSGGNRVSFNVQTICIGTGSQTTNGSGNVWRGYVYDGTNFNTYKGRVSEGVASNPNFDQNFGGSNTTYTTNSCSVQTETFSVRYRLRKNFASDTYIFIVGGDDGYRLSLDGGSTWVINQWSDHGYTVNSYSTTLSGNRDLVLEYYENGGDNRISFSLSPGVLPVHLTSFNVKAVQDKVAVSWEISDNSTPDHFEIERSSDGNSFNTIGNVMPAAGTAISGSISYSFTDNKPLPGSSIYRLKMIDVSGKITYSNHVQVKNTTSFAGIFIYPTITQGNISLISTDRLQKAIINLYDMNGRKVFSKYMGNVPAGITVPVSLQPTGTTKGMHVLQITNDNLIVDVKKIILQ